VNGKNLQNQSTIGLPFTLHCLPIAMRHAANEVSTTDY
jgi:hypothetical protein